MIFTNTQDVINNLYSLPKLHEKADLTYIKRILTFLDSPQDKVKTIHVTGTNGKGSTSYFLSNLLQKAGQKTGLFVSPYVFKFNERIQLNGKNISDNELISVANYVQTALEQIQKLEPNFTLVTFEYEVVMAFVYFAREKCDYAVIEVGIGGQHDKTNVITPLISVITTVGLDHEQIIGPTLQDIAREKSGVIKQHRPVVLGNVPKTVLPVIMKKARSEEAPVELLGRDFKACFGKNIIFSDSKRKLKFHARPQVEGFDAAIAVKAITMLELPLSDPQIEDAINETVVPGRYQILQDNPLIILDGAHNVQAMENLLNFAHHQQELRGGKLRILIMMMQDKDIAKVFSLFNSHDQVELTTIDYPRAAKKADFPNWIQKKYTYVSDCQEAFDQMRQSSQTNDILLVTGSFYLVGQILQMEAEHANKRH